MRTTCADRCCSGWGEKQKQKKSWKQRPQIQRRWACPRLSCCKTRSDTLGAPHDSPQLRPQFKPFRQEVEIMKRFLKILGIVIVLLIVVAIAIPFFIDANTFRPKLESELTDALGRQVKVGNLSLSLLSGSVSADNISIADDPAFGKSAFVEAKSLKVGVEMIPLIFSKT